MYDAKQVENWDDEELIDKAVSFAVLASNAEETRLQLRHHLRVRLYDRDQRIRRLEEQNRELEVQIESMAREADGGM